MKKRTLFLIVLAVFLITTYGNVLAFESPLKVGWVIGNDENNAVILHTKNWGQKWVVQGKWADYNGNDISAVDKQTAWAALGSTDLTRGIILHTTNGGTTLTEQTPQPGVDSIKNIKGLTRHEAWAVSLTGTILHTTDGGKVWNIVEHPDFPIKDVNRMDVIGYRDVRTADRSGKNTGKIHSNVWITDHFGEEAGHLGMIHTLYNGDIWRQEYIPGIVQPCQVHMVSAYSPRVVWAAAWSDGTLYRTTDGGETWDGIDTEVIGGNDLDDMCAYSADALWLVQYVSLNSGFIYHVRVFEDKEPEVKTFRPTAPVGYAYGGLTCVDDQTALALGYSYDPSTFPKGVIVSTTDGGDNWVSHPLPVDDVWFWKVSFVGARR